MLEHGYEFLWKYGPDLMRKVHAQFKSGKRSEIGDYCPPPDSLSRVAVSRTLVFVSMSYR